MSIARDLFDTQRFRAAERESNFATVVASIDWTAEPRADGFRVMAVSFNRDKKMITHKSWTVEKIGDAFTKVAEWKREIQLSQSQHSIIVKRV